MKPLKDYSQFRGVCHNPRLQGEHEQLETELGLLPTASTEVHPFLDAQGDSYFDVLDHFMRTAWRYGVSSMPILWNGNFIREWNDPNESWYVGAAAYASVCW